MSLLVNCPITCANIHCHLLPQFICAAGRVRDFLLYSTRYDMILWWWKCYSIAFRLRILGNHPDIASSWWIMFTCQWNLEAPRLRIQMKTVTSRFFWVDLIPGQTPWTCRYTMVHIHGQWMLPFLMPSLNNCWSIYQSVLFSVRSSGFHTHTRTHTTSTQLLMNCSFPYSKTFSSDHSLNNWKKIKHHIS